MSEHTVQFHSHEQNDALRTFPLILKNHLPYSNPLYNRLQAPHNVPTRHCLFASTFPPNTSSAPESYTIVFADRSRHLESQIWVFNPLITLKSLSSAQQDLLTSHITSLLHFLKHISIPLAPGWPFSSLLKFACLHETITATLLSIAEPKDALKYITKWNIWLVSTSALINAPAKPPKPLPEGFTISRVPEDQIQTVIDTSSIPRQASTYLMLPNVGILNSDGKLAAWGYIGIDGSLATLYVLPPYQRRGLATLVATELLKRLNEGGFRDLGYSGETGWVHADVYDGNAGSEAVMRSLGGKVWWESAYVRVDCEKF